MRQWMQIVPYLKDEAIPWRRKIGVGSCATLLVSLMFAALVYLTIDRRVHMSQEEIITVAHMELPDLTITVCPGPPDDPPTKNETPTPNLFDPPETPPEVIEMVDQGLPTIVCELPIPPIAVAKPTGPFVRDTKSRNKERAKYDHTDATERAVRRALAWLKDNQQADGSWESDRPVGVTGLALLTFLAHGETTSSKEYGDTVSRAVKYLLEKQDANGYFDRTGHQYSHGVATYAVGEAYALTNIPMLKAPVVQGVARIVEGLMVKSIPLQGSGTLVKGLDPVGRTMSAGLWDYKYGKSGRWDLSYSGWQIQALKTAVLGGTHDANIAQTLAIASNGIKAWQNESTGRFGYAAAGNGSQAMSSVGTLCLQMLGEGASIEARKGLAVLSDAECDFTKGGGSHPFYNWYYLTQAKFHQGGAAFDEWNDQFAPAFVKHQKADGHWQSISAGENSHGKAYTTSLASLTLMVYYRNLKSTSGDAVKPSSEESMKDSGDIVVELTSVE